MSRQDGGTLIIILYTSSYYVVVLIILCVIYDNAVLQSLGKYLLFAYNALD